VCPTERLLTHSPSPAGSSARSDPISRSRANRGLDGCGHDSPPCCPATGANDALPNHPWGVCERQSCSQASHGLQNKLTYFVEMTSRKDSRQSWERDSSFGSAKPRRRFVGINRQLVLDLRYRGNVRNTTRGHGEHGSRLSACAGIGSLCGFPSVSFVARAEFRRPTWYI